MKEKLQILLTVEVRKEQCSMLGNGIVGVLAESSNMWERRTPLCPSHCARLLHCGKEKGGVDRIIVQPSTKRVHHDAYYEDVGCTVSEDISECGLILGIKQPKLDVILPDRAYAFFSHTHKAQSANMPLLDMILAQRVTLYDYELIVGDNGKRLLAFGKYAGQAGLIDFLSGLGKRYLSLGYYTPFLTLGASYMYPSLAAAKAAVLAVGEEIAATGLPSGISPLVFIFTGSGNVSQGAQEIFKLLPHIFIDPLKLSGIHEMVKSDVRFSQSRRIYKVYGCVVTCKDMVVSKDSEKRFDKAEYYAHPEHYYSIFHERIAPYASIIVNCMYWEKRFPRLLTTKELQELKNKGSPLVGVCDITCDIGGALEFINQTTSPEMPHFRYNPLTDLYNFDMVGDGIICQSIDILPTEFAKEASQHFGDILSQFVGYLSFANDISCLPSYLHRACIAHRGSITALYEYIPRIRSSLSDTFLNNGTCHFLKTPYTMEIAISGHLFDQYLINEALDIIEAAGGSFRLVRCDVGQRTVALSYSELEVGADDKHSLEQIIDSLTFLANPNYEGENIDRKTRRVALKFGNINQHRVVDIPNTMWRGPDILILGAGRVCHPAVQFLTSNDKVRSACRVTGTEDLKDVKVTVASLYMKDAEEAIEGIPNAAAVHLDIRDSEGLFGLIKQVKVVISLLPPSCHAIIANACLQMKKHLVTASYINDSMSKLNKRARNAGITILCEMGLDPGIDHMIAMKIINQASIRGGKIQSFSSYCGGLPSPTSANNPLGYKFSWNPVGAIRAGQNAATYKSKGKILHVKGCELYDSATQFRIPYNPAFALECLPNRDSLFYGDLYGIGNDASTIFRGTLRYEGFSEIMSCLSKLGFFDDEVHPTLKDGKKVTFSTFFDELMKVKTEHLESLPRCEEGIVDMLVSGGFCKGIDSAKKLFKIIELLGLREDVDIPSTCQSAFDVTCSRMEERLFFSSTEQDMVLLHHEVELSFPDGGPTENHCATLLELGRMENGRNVMAMARTVGITAAIGALLLLANKVHTRGIIRPVEPEIYMPALDILEACGLKIIEEVELKGVGTRHATRNKVNSSTVSCSGWPTGELMS